MVNTYKRLIIAWLYARCGLISSTHKQFCKPWSNEIENMRPITCQRVPVSPVEWVQTGQEYFLQICHRMIMYRISSYSRSILCTELTGNTEIQIDVNPRVVKLLLCAYYYYYYYYVIYISGLLLLLLLLLGSPLLLLLLETFRNPITITLQTITITFPLLLHLLLLLNQRNTTQSDYKVIFKDLYYFHGITHYHGHIITDNIIIKQSWKFCGVLLSNRESNNLLLANAATYYYYYYYYR